MAAKKSSETCAIIMMAGMGTRMKSDIPKVLHQACGEALGRWVLDACDRAGIKNRVTVIGHCADEVAAAFPGEKFVLQEPQKGTGHAAMVAFEKVPKSSKHVLVLSGDVPC